jgi:hypothetical protein
MSRLRLPPFHDIARLTGRDPDETEAKLYDYYANPAAAFFNYRCARGLARFVYGRQTSLQQIVDGCMRERTEQGRSCNREVIELLWNITKGRSVQTFDLAPAYLPIRKDLSIRVALPFYFVENGRPCAFWLQPRRGYALSVGELALLASMVKHAVLVDDFRDVDFEVCDMSAPNPKSDRKPTLYHLDSFKILSREELGAKLQFVAIAYDRLVARGVQRSQRTPKNPPSTGRDLFS